MKEFFKKIFRRGNIIKRRNEKFLKRIQKDLLQWESGQESRKKVRILYGPSFAIYQTCFLHDRVMAAALRLRGAQIVPVYCDSVQSVECNYWGGVWGGGSDFAKNCSNCAQTSKELWKNSPVVPITFSRHLEESDIRAAREKAENLGPGDWSRYEEDGLPFGSWAKDILINNYVVGDYSLVPDHEFLGTVHLTNLLMLKTVYERILDESRPDRVVSNDSYYGMWALLQKLSERRDIPFYSNWEGSRRGAWCYALNDASMNLDMSSAWVGFEKGSLDERQKNKVFQWLEDRRTGEEMVFDTASLAEHQDVEADMSTYDSEKPTALLVSNVIWDLAALNKQIVFSDMIDWIIETIEWFRQHPQYQLIVKPHPAELSPAIPETRERVGTALEIRRIELPDNVLLLSPKSKITVYQLFDLTDVVLTHTSTVGIEMAANGKPVVTTANSPYRNFGFTYDPEDRSEYFSLLKRILEGENGHPDRDIQVDLACKFILLFWYHYYMKLDILDYTHGETARFKVESLKDIIPGKNIYLDYVADSIIDGLPILSATRCPPES